MDKRVAKEVAVIIAYMGLHPFEGVVPGAMAKMTVKDVIAEIRKRLGPRAASSVKITIH